MIYAKAKAHGLWQDFQLPGGPVCWLQVTDEAAYLRLPAARVYPAFGSLDDFYPLVPSLQFDDRLRVFRQRLNRYWGNLSSRIDGPPSSFGTREARVTGGPDKVAKFVRADLELLQTACSLRLKARYSEGHRYYQIACLAGSLD